MTNKAMYGADFFDRIGAKGGKNGHFKGFFVNRDLASEVGRIGGQNSKRGQPL